MIKQIGKYEILSELGRGAFGRVFRARDPLMGREVAVKVLIADTDKSLLDRFRSEAESAGKLRHENIVTVYEYGDDHSVPYIAMELLEKTVQQIIEAREPLPLLEKLTILSQAAQGLACAHGNGIVHRDVKPANIMLAHDRSVKVTDFGIARVTGSADTRRTQQGQLIGTLYYMAPERLHGADADFSADIFAWGVIAYELLAGEYPFPGNDPGAVMYRITSVDPPPLREKMPDCPPGLDFVVQRAIAKDRELRYPTFEDITYDLHPIVQEVCQKEAAILMRDVEQMVAAGDSEAAQAKIRRVLDLDPGNARAREIRRRLLDEASRQHVKARFDALLRDGEEQFRQRHYPEAIQKFESAQRLDPTDARASEALERARSRREANRRAAALISESRRELQRGNLTLALDQVMGALGADAENAEAQLLRDEVSQQLDARDKQRRLHLALQRAQEFRSHGDFESALSVLAAVESEQPGSLLVAGVKAQIENERNEADRRVRAERYHSAMNEIHGAMHGGKLAEAQELLQVLRREFPGDSAVTELLYDVGRQIEAQRRAETLRHLSTEAMRLLHAQTFHKAREVLEDGLRSFPAEPGLQHLLETTVSLEAAHNRAEAVARVVDRGRQLRDDGDIEAALQHINMAGSEFQGEALLVEFRAQLELQREQQRYARGVQQALDHGRSLIASGKLAEAVAELERSAAAYPAESEISSVLMAARRARVAQEERTFVESVLAEVQDLEGRPDLPAAFQCAEQALRRYPYNPQLSNAAHRLREMLREHERRERVTRHLQGIEAALKAADWLTAANALQTAMQECPGDSAFAGFEERVERTRLESELQAMASQVRARLDNNDLAGAMRRLNETQTRFRQESLWQELNAEVQRRREYQEIIAEARRRMASGDLQKAEALLQDAAAHAVDGTADALLTELREQRGRRQVDDAIAAAQRESDLMAKREDWAGAAAIWQRLSEAHPDDPRITEARERAVVQVSEAERRHAEKRRIAEAVDRAIAAARTREEQRDWVGALARVESALAEYGDQPALKASAERLRRVVATEQRRERLAGYLRAIDSAVTARKWDEATGLIHKAETDFPGEGVVEQRRSQIAEAQRFDRFDVLCSRIRDLLNRGDLDRAAADLHSGEAEFGTDPAWKRLHANLEHRIAYEAALTRAASIPSQGNPQPEAIAGAEAILLDAVRNNPPDDRAARLLARITELRVRAERESDIRKGLTEAAALKDKGDSGTALAALDRLWAQFPDDVAVTEARNAAAELHSVNQILARAARLEAEQNWPAALSQVEEALPRYPRNPNLLAAVSRLRAAVRSAQCQDAIRTIEDRIAADRLDEAARQIEASRRAYPEQQCWGDLQSRVDRRRKEVQEELQEQLKREFINQILARVIDLQKNQAPAALQELQTALQRYPDDPELLAAVHRLRQTVADEERRQRITHYVQRIEDALLRRRWQEADEQLNAARREFSEEKIFAELDSALAAARKQEADARKREQSRLQAYESGLAEAAKYRAELEFRAAESVLRQLISDDPPDMRAATLLHEVAGERMERERTAERQQAVAAAVSAGEAGDFRAALSELDRLRQNYPDDPAIAQHRRDLRTRLYEQELAAAQALLGQSEYARAQEVLAPVLPDAPDDRAAALLERVRAGKRRHDREQQIAQGVAECDNKLRAGDMAGALAVITELSRRFADVPQLAIRRQEIEERQFTAVTLADIREMELRGDWEQALRKIGEAAARYPNAELTSAAERLDEAVRRHRLATLVRDAEASLAAFHLDEAQRVIETGRKTHPQEPVWDRLGHDLESRRRYEAALRHAETLREQQKYTEARTVLEDARQNSPDSRAAVLLTAILTESTRREREQATAATRKEAERLAAAGKLTEALAVLDQGIARFPDDPPLARDRKSLQARFETEFVNQTLARASDLQKQDAAAALREIDSALARFPKNRELSAAAQRMKDFVRREEARHRLAQAIASVESLLGAHEWTRAEAELAEMKRQFPQEKVVGELERTLRESRRQYELEQLMAGIEQSLSEGKVAEAKNALAAAKGEFGREAAWREAEHQIERHRLYQQSLDKAAQLRKRGDLAAADTLLRQLIPNAPDTRAVLLLQAIAEERLQKERPEILQRGQQDAERLAAEGKLAEAIAAIDALRRDYPDEPGLRHLRTKFEGQLAAAKPNTPKQKHGAEGIPVPPPMPQAVPPKNRRFVVMAGIATALLAVGIVMWLPRGPQNPSPPRPTLKPSVSEILFTHQAGSPDPDQPVTFEALAAPFTVAAEDPWIVVQPESGTRLEKVNVSVKTASLRPGLYTSSMTVRSGELVLKIPVRVEITGAPPPGQAELRFSPERLTFRYISGGAPPASQQVRLIGGQVQSVSTSATWLRAVRTRTGIEVTVQPANLGPGGQDGLVTVTSSDGQRSVLPVHLDIQARAEPLPPAPTEPVLTPHEISPREWLGPHQGRVIWSGDVLLPGKQIILDQDRVHFGGGSLTGSYPGIGTALSAKAQQAGVEVTMHAQYMMIRNIGTVPLNRVVVEWQFVR